MAKRSKARLLRNETQPQRYLRLYRWLKRQGYTPKTARASAWFQAGYVGDSRKYWYDYWRYR